MYQIVGIENRSKKTTICIACRERLAKGTICESCERRFLPLENSAIAVCKNCCKVHILRNNLTEVHPNIYAMEYIGACKERHIYEIDACKDCDPQFEKRIVGFKRLVPEGKT